MKWNEKRVVDCSSVYGISIFFYLFFIFLYFQYSLKIFIQFSRGHHPLSIIFMKIAFILFKRTDFSSSFRVLFKLNTDVFLLVIKSVWRWYYGVSKSRENEKVFFKFFLQWYRDLLRLNGTFDSNDKTKNWILPFLLTKFNRIAKSKYIINHRQITMYNLQKQINFETTELDSNSASISINFYFWSINQSLFFYILFSMFFVVSEFFVDEGKIRLEKLNCGN